MVFLLLLIERTNCKRLRVFCYSKVYQMYQVWGPLFHTSIPNVQDLKSFVFRIVPNVQGLGCFVSLIVSNVQGLKSFVSWFVPNIQGLKSFVLLIVPNVQGVGCFVSLIVPNVQGLASVVSHKWTKIRRPWVLSPTLWGSEISVLSSRFIATHLLLSAS